MTIETALTNRLYGVLLLDAGGRILSANEAAAGLLGLSAESLSGRPFHEWIRAELVSEAEDWAELLWESVRAIYLGEVAAATFDMPDGERRVWLKLEASASDPVAYWAYLEAMSDETAAAAEAAPGDAFSVLAEHSPAGFFDLDYRANAARYSDACRRMLGYERPELADDPDAWLGLIHPEDSAAAPDKLRSRKGAGGLQTFSREFRLRHRDGHFVWVWCVGVQVVGADDALERVCGLQLDISDRKELEEQSLEDEDRLALLTGEAGLAAFDLDWDRQRHWFSAAWAERFHTGVEGSYPEPTPLLELLPPEQIAMGFGQLFPANAGKTGGRVRIPLRGGDGTVSATILYCRHADRQQGVRRLTGFVVPEILEEKTEASGVGAAPYFEELFSALAEGVLVVNSHGELSRLNEKAGGLLHAAPEELVGRPFEEVFPLVHLESNHPATGAVELSLVGGEPVLCAEHGLRGEDGVLRPIVWTARQFWNEAGAIAGFFVIFRDPHEMDLTPAELLRANRFEALGLLAGGISHDFNNLLTTILGGISTARDSRDYNRLDDAESACLAAKTLTRQLLMAAKGGSHAVRQTLPTVDVLQNAVRIAAAGSTCRVVVDAAAGVDPIHVDRGQIVQVFQNLIINAIQAMREPTLGVVVLRAGNIHLAEGDVEGLAAGDYVRIEVADNGSGIPPEVADHIFDPFFTTKKNGTGLGLATVLSIVRRHGGQIGLETEVGKGTTFTVFLPRATEPVEPKKRMAPSLRFGTGRILLMDDDPKICELTGGMIANLDYTYDIARNGEEAVQLYRRYLNVSRPYDAVILDLNIIGGMGGEECFHRLRELDPDVRAILSSGYDDDELTQRLLDLGFAGVLTKPYRMADVGRVLKQALGRAN